MNLKFTIEEMQAVMNGFKSLNDNEQRDLLATLLWLMKKADFEEKKDEVELLNIIAGYFYSRDEEEENERQNMLKVNAETHDLFNSKYIVNKK